MYDFLLEEVFRQGIFLYLRAEECRGDSLYTGPARVQTVKGANWVFIVQEENNNIKYIMKKNKLILD